jgi:hypothetical protein
MEGSVSCGVPNRLPENGWIGFLWCSQQVAGGGLDMRLSAIGLVFAGLSIGCGGQNNELWGSIDATLSLEFTKVDLIKQGVALRIEYIKELGEGEEVACKVVVDTANLQIVPNSDLKNEAFEKGIVTLDRTAAGEFPPISSGLLHFDDYEFKRKGALSGGFTILFENGRNLFGDFEGKLKEIEADVL